MSLCIGVAGCGAMGLPMAQNLLKSGIDVWGYDVRPGSEFGNFAHRMVADPRAFSSKIDVLVSVVRNWQQTQDLCFDIQAVFQQPAYPKILVISSTLSPRVLAPLKERLPDDVVLVDAPMSGAPYRAGEGTLTFMVGGDDDIVGDLDPVFLAMGETVHHLGPTGAGMACKVVNNFVAASSVVAVRHALRSAATLGIDSKTILAVMQTSSGSTWFGDNFDKIDWAGQKYDPQNTMGILEKDMMAYLDALNGTPDQGDDIFEQAVLSGLRAMKGIKQ